MNETMGQIIKRLRKERNLTQEELAEQLNISAPAISKWENDTSMPDISQVVPLAIFFGVTTDVLFGVHGTDHTEEIKVRLAEIYRICDNCKDGEEGPTALVVLDKYREAMRLYPNNPNILTEAIAFAEMVISQNNAELSELIGEEGVEDLTSEMIRWAELVIKYSTNIDKVLSAKSRLMNIHTRRRNWNEAYTLADSFPCYIHNNRSIRMADLKFKAGETAEELELRCLNIKELADQLGYQATMLGNIYRNDGSYEEALYCYTFFRDMVEAIYREEKYRPPFVYDHYPLYRFPAECLIKLERYDEAVTMLEEGVDFILAQAENYNKKTELDVPLLKDCSFGYGFDGNAKYYKVVEKLKNIVSGDALVPLADHPRYKALVAKVENMK